jgi:hypothetical protein
MPATQIRAKTAPTPRPARRTELTEGDLSPCATGPRPIGPRIILPRPLTFIGRRNQGAADVSIHPRAYARIAAAVSELARRRAPQPAVFRAPAFSVARVHVMLLRLVSHPDLPVLSLERTGRGTFGRGSGSAGGAGCGDGGSARRQIPHHRQHHGSGGRKHAISLTGLPRACVRRARRFGVPARAVANR